MQSVLYLRQLCLFLQECNLFIYLQKYIDGVFNVVSKAEL